MAKNDNLTDFLTDVADAIRAKKGTTDKINPQDFAAEIASIEGGGGTPSASSWTGHADAEGLRAIGWTEEDIAYYQKYGVNWMEEDDYLYKVPDDNKALYGVLNATNIADYKERIVYLPKIDVSGVTSMNSFFEECSNLVSIPYLDTSHITNMNYMFKSCSSLVCVPRLDMSNVTSMSSVFIDCSALAVVPKFDTGKAKTMQYGMQNCQSLRYFHALNASNATNMNYFFRYCSSLTHISELDVAKATLSSAFSNCRNLKICLLKNVVNSFSLSNSSTLRKESIIYIINNEAATKNITITLHGSVYEKYAEDEEVLAALANHPFVSLASA